jgi:hypothetical protein
MKPFWFDAQDPELSELPGWDLPGYRYIETAYRSSNRSQTSQSNQVVTSTH